MIIYVGGFALLAKTTDDPGPEISEWVWGNLLQGNLVGKKGGVSSQFSNLNFISSYNLVGKKGGILSLAEFTP
jgi:hypothetical protein